MWVTFKPDLGYQWWSPEKLKMVKKHFSPELSGGLWGVICYRHWYPRAGLEAAEKSYFFKKSFEVEKDAELPPEYFPCGGSAWILTWSWFINLSKSYILQEKSFESKKWCRITPWVFSMRRFRLNPSLELISKLFKKSHFRWFVAIRGPVGPFFGPCRAHIF